MARSLTPFSVSGGGASSKRRACASPRAGVLPSLLLAIGRLTPSTGLPAEHPEFAMDARRTPTGIVSDHLKDQFPDLLEDPAATAHWIPHFAEHGPVQFEPGSMPARNGVRDRKSTRLNSSHLGISYAV